MSILFKSTYYTFFLVNQKCNIQILENQTFFFFPKDFFATLELSSAASENFGFGFSSELG